MAAQPYLCVLLLLALHPPALTATPEGLGVRQYPPSLSVVKGENATLSCHFKADSHTYSVQWFKMESEKQPIPQSPRQTVVKNQTSFFSLLEISEVTLKDSGWYYCEVNVLQKDPEWGNGTELVVLAPPAPPKIYLEASPEPQSGQWVLLCLTGEFHPRRITLSWTYQSADTDIDHLSVSNCTLPSSNLPDVQAIEAPLSPIWLVNSSPLHQSKCLQVVDSHSREVYLFSVVFLPKKQSLKTGITFTCGVYDHPALTDALTASFTWDAPANELIVYLNILKMCFLSAMTAVFLLEAVKYFWVRGK